MKEVVVLKRGWCRMVITSPFKFIFSFFFFSVTFSYNGSDTISTGQSLSPNQTIVSDQGRFELGFFSPGDSTNHYVGIWYKGLPFQIVWVANRDDPISPSLYNTSRLQIDNGHLSLIVNSETIWTAAAAASSKATAAVLLDTGNFILRNNTSAIVWQSFDHPTGTWLPGGTLGFLNSEKVKLVSWKNADDPGRGSYSLEMDSNGGELLMKKNGSESIIWRSGGWRDGGFASLPNSSSLYTYTFSRSSRNGASFFTYVVRSESIKVRIMLHSSGILYQYIWSEARGDWFALAVEPSDPKFCSTYENCGANTICDVNYAPACRCLDGFGPRVSRDWDLFDFSNGCVRDRGLRCENDQKTAFANVSYATWRGSPESRNVSNNAECESFCSADCSCSAYSIGNSSGGGGGGGGGCLLFRGELIGLERLKNASVGDDIYVRMESSERKGRKKVLVVALAVPLTAAVVFCLCFCYLWPKFRSKVFRGKHQNLLLLDFNTNGHVEEKSNQYELPLFSFSSIAAATNNFSDANKLGEGGFGPVYRGELMNGQSVAVKRLSRSSGQGLEEFRNETELIAKLQHRNLVGILGYCTENEEKILVYEYMPNKSLDALNFDSGKKESIDWNKRVRIIEGIAQGLLYLHHYSRLRMVHRDLKASNILLDAEMNPKISDFGLARIFGGNDSRANTKRIVGTYGYMSPEYAMKGFFSLKSDVYSFGVLMLEIITGKTISGFYGSDRLSLLEYAWKFWKHGRVIELVDPILEISASSSAASKYLKIALLCVQENAADRPLMSDIVAMLSNEEKEIASPKIPAFSVGMSSNPKANPVESKVEVYSVNHLTLSQVEAR